ncbi:class I mannose-6-phosphate isomerase [Oscillatoria amoena NRMC-F 0135]|nr:class I mannose-6-phosphate isomerase [Oscillatoria amoena NRMC-F 0135]
MTTTSLYPLKFKPLFMERVWGGRNLQRIFHRHLPEGKVIGESWEICDRPEEQTVIANGPLAGKSLHEAVGLLGHELMGGVPLLKGRFPLLIKFLDAQERLSLQVHPPAQLADSLGGEPKTEMWVIADATPEAHLIAGLKNGVTREQFARALGQNALEPLCHRFPVKAGDVMFLPSGRLHAIDAGNVIVEIQQNSDTTYRVYDWGRPRELHIDQSLASIHFDDPEPALSAQIAPDQQSQPLVSCEYFTVTHRQSESTSQEIRDGKSFEIVICLGGEGSINGENFGHGDVILIPAGLKEITINVKEKTLSWLSTVVQSPKS